MHDIDRLAGSQYGLITWAQLFDAGVPASSVGRLVERGALVRVLPGVYRVAGAPVTWYQRQLAAVLAAGPEAAASHRAGAYLWDVWDGAPDIEIIIPRRQALRLPGVIVHRTRDPMRIHVRKGIPVTTPMRVMVDLGAVVPPDGVLEPRFARLLKQASLPPAVFQFRVGRYEIDFAYPDQMIAIEVDGYGPHASRKAFQDDRDRQNILVGRGWTVLRFTWADVVRRPDHVARVIASVIGQRQAAIAE